MKKIIISLCIILSIFSLLGCREKSVSTKIDISIDKSTKFSEREINNAIYCVEDNFNFPACTLTKIWYDEEKSNEVIKGYLTDGKGYLNGVEPENVIVLFSEFYVDDSGNNPVLDADSTYSDYNWILIRAGKKSSWIIDDCGY